jgi:hypothetical protein
VNPTADGLEYELTRVRLSDGWETTVYLVRYPLANTSVRVVCFPDSERLDQWCAAHEQPEAIVAGFFLRDPYRPLGEVRLNGAVVEHEPISPPGGPSAGACTSRGTSGSDDARSSPAIRRAISCRPGPYSCRTGGP